jgi:hypothetical protein
MEKKEVKKKEKKVVEKPAAEGAQTQAEVTTNMIRGCKDSITTVRAHLYNLKQRTKKTPDLEKEVKKTQMDLMELLKNETVVEKHKANLKKARKTGMKTVKTPFDQLLQKAISA